MCELHFLQPFWQHQAHPIPFPYELEMIQCSKQVVNSFSCNFLGNSRCNHVANVAQGLKDRVPKKKLVLYVESWIYFIYLFKFT
jgi:hypothetical protein